jgi:hypothetical protein
LDRRFVAGRTQERSTTVGRTVEDTSKGHQKEQQKEPKEESNLVVDFDFDYNNNKTTKTRRTTVAPSKAVIFVKIIVYFIDDVSLVSTSDLYKKYARFTITIT